MAASALQSNGLLGLMADGLDIVAVRIEDEGAVVVLMILRSQTRWPVVSAACGQGRLMKRIDRVPIGYGEGEMKVGTRSIAFRQTEFRLALSQGNSPWEFHDY